MPSARTTAAPRRPRVVIIGAGFGGLNAAKALAGQPVDVVLIDRNNYHKFQPLLYQVATAGLEPDEIVHPIRDVFRKHPNIRFQLGTVRAIDKANRQVHLNTGPPVAYDSLIVAAGATTNYFGVEGAEAHALPMKSVPDALHLRNHILRCFERAERDPERMPEGLLNFVIVGGGPTGVELAGQMMELFRCVMRDDFRSIDTHGARVILVEMLPEVLAAYAEPLRAYTRQALEKRGVEVRTGTTVARVTADAVHLKGGERLPTHTLIWAAGVKAAPLAGQLGTPQQRGGRLVVEDDLSLPGHPEIFAIGDVGGGADAAGEMYAQLATVAIQQGRHAARQVQRRARGEATAPFAYTDPGIMATIGRNDAIAQLPGGLRIKGFIAWLMWAGIHIAKLVGFRNRLDVLVNWVYNYITYNFSARLILDVVPTPEDAPAAASGGGQQRRAQPARRTPAEAAAGDGQER